MGVVRRGQVTSGVQEESRKHNFCFSGTTYIKKKEEEEKGETADL